MCITQDDDMDWQDEILNMGEIYRNSWLTLSAAKSVDGTGGLFSETNGEPIRYFAQGTQQCLYARWIFRKEDPDQPSTAKMVDPNTIYYPNLNEHLDMKTESTRYERDFPLSF